MRLEDRLALAALVVGLLGFVTGTISLWQSNHSLSTAREANTIAEESNDIAKRADARIEQATREHIFIQAQRSDYYTVRNLGDVQQHVCGILTRVDNLSTNPVSIVAFGASIQIGDTELDFDTSFMNGVDLRSILWLSPEPSSSIDEWVRSVTFAFSEVDDTDSLRLKPRMTLDGDSSSDDHREPLPLGLHQLRLPFEVMHLPVTLPPLSSRTVYFMAVLEQQPDRGPELGWTGGVGSVFTDPSLIPVTPRVITLSDQSWESEPAECFTTK